MTATTTIRVTIYTAEVSSEVWKISTDRRAEIAGQVADNARAAAPVLTGAFRGGIGVEVNGDDVRVVDDDPDSGFKEYGTSDTPAHATLTSAAAAFGRYSGIQPRGTRAVRGVSARVPARKGIGR